MNVRKVKDRKNPRYYKLPLRREGWQRRNAEGDIDLEFCDQHITHIIDRFEKPLKNAGFESADVIEEWHDLISYTIAFLNCSST